MTDDEKIEIVDGLLDFYGGWLEMSYAMLGESETNSDGWRRYHQGTRAYTDDLSKYDLNSDQRWHRAWRLAFWDAITQCVKS